MLNKSIGIALGFALLAVTAAAPAHSEEYGQIPYSAIHKAVSRAATIRNPRVRAMVKVQSTAARPAGSEKIKLTIQAKAGDIEVMVDPDGEIRSFPMRDDLLRENPFVRSNLPRGTSELTVSVSLVLPDTNTYSARDLGQRLDEANAEIKKAAGMILGFVLPRFKTLHFVFQPAARQTLTIGGKSGRVLTANESGLIDLTLDPKTIAEDAPITVSAKPDKVYVGK